ncbi:hypothetical protein COA07_15115 [Sphingomonas adhaesiva]|uniref:Uncharacterized protein n=2 Tax=Sphingomonas adhaesiva TaxID=28212 RepID=A0A2A4I480_9SPHN|nr:hypothetical protein COA07_15115 [Sphingomonas adhaesiva]
MQGRQTLPNAQRKTYSLMAKELDEQQAAEVASIRERIKDLIERAFAKGKPAYFLAQLGNELSDQDRKTLEHLTGTKVARFVMDNFDYEVGRTGQHENILYLVAPHGNGAIRPELAPRYNGRFWAAFKIPLDAGEQRFINLETFEFGPDATAIAAQDAQVREISPDFLPRGGEVPTSEEILKRIAGWLEAQKLDQAAFLIQRRKRHRGQDDLLSALINALDKDQLKRVSLPLDVIQTLGTTKRD